MNKTDFSIFAALALMIAWGWACAYFNSFLPKWWVIEQWYGLILVITEVGVAGLIFVGFMFYDLNRIRRG